MTTDVANRMQEISTALSSLNRAKLDLEYAVQKAKSAGLIPNSDGTLPSVISLDSTSTYIGNSDVTPAEYVAGMVAIENLIACLTSAVSTSNTTTNENALLQLAR